MKTSSKTYHSFPWTHEGVDYIVEFVYFTPVGGGKDHGVQVEPDGGDEVEILRIRRGITQCEYDEFNELDREAEKAAYAWMAKEFKE